MTPRQFFEAKNKRVCEAVATKAGTSYSNFFQIKNGGSCSPRLAERLAEASNFEMTELEILYPERYEESQTMAATS